MYGVVSKEKKPDDGVDGGVAFVKISSSHSLPLSSPSFS